jgi:hypothetical protein
MASTTPTEFWNDSCATADLTYALEHGGVGATSNPTIVASEFDGFGATARTLRTFIDSYFGLVSFIRDLRIPNPDK